MRRQYYDFLAVIATFAAADGFGSPMKLITPSDFVIDDNLQVTCNITDSALEIREVKSFRIQKWSGNSLPPQLILKWVSKGNVTASLQFTVGRDVEGQYLYCLVNSIFRSNIVKLFVPKIHRMPVFLKPPDNCTVYSGYSVNTEIVIQSEISPDVACLAPRKNACICSTVNANNVTYVYNDRQRLHTVSCGVPVTTSGDEGWYSIIATVTNTSLSTKFYVTVIDHPFPPAIEVIETPRGTVVKWHQPTQTNVSGSIDIPLRHILTLEKKGSRIARHLVVPVYPNSYYLGELEPCTHYYFYMQSQGEKLVSNSSSKVAVRTNSPSSYGNRFLIDPSTNEVIIESNGVLAPACLQRQFTNLELADFCKNTPALLEVNKGDRKYKNFHEVHPYWASRKLRRSGSLSSNACPTTVPSCEQERRLKKCKADLGAGTSMVKIFSDLVHRTKAYEIITGVIIVVLLGIIFLSCFCLRRQLRGRGANAPKEMEGLQQTTRANQSAIGELLTITGDMDEKTEKVLNMLQTNSQTNELLQNGNVK